MGGKDSEVEQTTTSEPPAWAKPLLEAGAADALKLYNQGKGFSVYTGPTQAPLSDQTLGAMNSIMRMTGAGPNAKPITNQSINALVPNISMDDFAKRAPKTDTERQRNNGYWSGAFGVGQHNLW